MAGKKEEPPGEWGAGIEPQADFCALEQRYRPMVYGTALRSVGCPETAGEVTQDVFLLLSRKGLRLSAEHLCGWLHRAAVLKARERLRGERRYRRRVAEYARRKDSEASAPAADPLLDRLDVALDTLSEADRHVIFLRYFEGLNASEIATRLNISAEAAQKKCERARARLAEKLAAGGLLTAAAAHLRAGELLKAAAGQAPPVRLASVVSKGTAAFPRWARWGGAATLATLVTLPILWKAIPRFIEDHTSGPAAHVPAPPIRLPDTAVSRDASAGTKAATATTPASFAQPGALDLLKLAALLEQADAGDATAGVEAETRLRRTQVEALQQAASAVPALTASPNQLRVLAQGLVRHLITRDPRRAVLAGESLWRAQHGASAPTLAALVQEALWAWSRNDAAAAREWYDSIASEGLFEDRGEDTPGMSPENFSAALRIQAEARSLELQVALAERLCLHPQPEDPAWPAMADVWAHTLTPIEARTLADALWQNPVVSREAAFTLRLALVTLPTSAPEQATLVWAATPHGAATPDPTLASAVAAAWQRRRPNLEAPEWMKPHLTPASGPESE